jgi:hypothetical protein
MRTEHTSVCDLSPAALCGAMGDRGTTCCVRQAGSVFAAALAIVLAGCGTPGAPLPPSLNLPDRVTDLSAVRAGNQVLLNWTMPKRNTDKLPLNGNVDVYICRQEAAGACSSAGELQLAPSAKGSLTETLPPTLAAGVPRALSYYVELRNRNGRSAGLSNAAVVLAGAAPAPVAGLAAELRRQGVVLRWTAEDDTAAIRLRRRLLTPAPAKPHEGLLTLPPEPLEQNLIVEPTFNSAPKLALDQAITVGQTYEYRAQRVVRMAVDGANIDLDGVLSPPLRVEASDIFPPSVPTGLAAVAIAADSTANSEASIDLSWQANTEPDLAGYEIYRREGQIPWQRISGDQPAVGPAFHDAHVLAGHTYRYGVSAVDKAGHESGRSADATETVPNP